jgi:Cu-Zn family superoxide dismutase
VTTRLRTSADAQLDGQAAFEQRVGGVYVRVTVQNAAAGTYAVHVHEKPDCSDIPGKSMGGHFNPTGASHGMPWDDEHHLGDLGNLTVRETGMGSLEILVPNASLRPGGEDSFLDRALVIHSGPDDGEGDSGHAGKPMACGAIRGDVQ